MKVVILAGGLGSRLSEETTLKPKPMVEIGGKPILWHIMKIYAAHGISEFIVCLGYRGYMVKEWFANYSLHTSDVTFNLATGSMKVLRSETEPWQVTLVDTGEQTMTGGRIKRVTDYVGDDTFCLTYGDGLSDLPVGDLIDFHRRHGKLATVTAIQPPGRFGALDVVGDAVLGFQEKPKGDGAWMNGGFFVLEPEIAEYIDGDATVWEQEPMRRLAAEGQVSAFRHTGFWQAMDTLRERNLLEEMWAQGSPPWKSWE